MTLAGILLVAFVAHRDINVRRDTLVMEAESLVAARPYLQLNLYYRDRAAMAALLDELMGLSPAIKYGVLYDNQGNTLSSRSRPWAQLDAPPDLDDLRRSLSPLDAGLRSSPGGAYPEELALLAALVLGERSIELTIPVTSVLNPLRADLPRSEFIVAMADPEQVRSLFVAGYAHLGISNVVLWRQSAATVAIYAAIALFGVLIIYLAARSIARLITAPVRELADVAYDIATGKHTEPLVVRGSTEIREIAGVLNGIIAGLHQYTRQLDTDRKILNLKVTEQSERLTQRSEELDRAVRKMSETRDKLRHLAYFDSLTSLPNRRLFSEQLTLLLRLASRSKEKIGLLIVDIDNFKRINDSLGTKAGDELLRQIGDRLAHAIRDGDILHRRPTEDGSIMDLSRLGGDEFTVVLNNIENANAARTAAERIAERVCEPLTINQSEITITATIGIALAPDHADTVEGLLTAASAAALSAKKTGRNRIAIYESSMEGGDRERLKLETDLRKAVERDQLLLHFQPQVQSDTGEVVGVESLVRWQHPEMGLIPPFRWIPVAEELGIIDEVGTWVLGEACRTLLQLRGEGYRLPKISVNVSALQFSEDFVDTVAQTLRDSGLPPDSLELELTETIMINDEESIVQRVSALKDLGVRLSIDDFGTGYSSLSYLSRFPLDGLKIDRSFVLGLAEGKRNKELVRAIISLGHSLHLDIVVEGVEHVDELKFFRDEDARVIQGYLFSAPVPLDKLRDILKDDHFSDQLRVLDRMLDGSVAGGMQSA